MVRWQGLTNTWVDGGMDNAVSVGGKVSYGMDNTSMVGGMVP